MDQNAGNKMINLYKKHETFNLFICSFEKLPTSKMLNFVSKLYKLNIKELCLISLETGEHIDANEIR